MEFVETELSGLFILKPKIFNDNRGSFIKTFNSDIFEQNNLIYDFKECYYSTSQKDVIRGMHFQNPPKDHIKLVYVPYGRIIDVILDIRKNSKTYGKFISLNLSSENGFSVYIPSGFAHGFISLEDGTIVTYMQTSTHSPAHDNGIKYDSFGMNWNLDLPILSNRDLSFIDFDNFESPF
ncbi:MAG: dTDP-4-dehydrorhamnose 3,5-epimerase [Candidatus Sericytochromatia bacterium]